MAEQAERRVGVRIAGALHRDMPMTGIEAALFGTLTRNADQRTSKNGKPFTLLNVVVGDGDGRQFVSVIVFGDAAIDVGDLEKGRRVYVEGKIELSEWTDRDGVKRSGLKITSFNAREVSKIGRRRDAKAKPVVTPVPVPDAANDFYNDDMPF
jgi:single-stranded DNA-binding protein